jgi:hypothetical protein
LFNTIELNNDKTVFEGRLRPRTTIASPQLC